jgi:predicted RND superfamily exporter protein
MDSKIFENSYVVALITFILLIAIFYVFKIGYKLEYQYDPNQDDLSRDNQKNNKLKPIYKFSIRYPLAIALMVWIYWHFFLFPTEDTNIINQIKQKTNINQNSEKMPESTNRTVPDAKIYNKEFIRNSNHTAGHIVGGSTEQKINMEKWI